MAARWQSVFYLLQEEKAAGTGSTRCIRLLQPAVQLKNFRSLMQNLALIPPMEKKWRLHFATQAFRNWKRYRGGWKADIHIFNLANRYFGKYFSLEPKQAMNFLCGMMIKFIFYLIAALK